MNSVGTRNLKLTSCQLCSIQHILTFKIQDKLPSLKSMRQKNATYKFQAPRNSKMAGWSRLDDFRILLYYSY
jgi:hypothetical protein